MDISVGHIHFPEHVRQRLRDRRVRYSAIRDRVREAARMVDSQRRVRVALVGQEPPVIVEFRPPRRATVVTVLPSRAGAGGQLVKLLY